MGHLSDQELRNHSNYHLFRLSEEQGSVKFRGKQFPFDSEFTPKCGLRLLKEDTTFEPVPAAEFRVDKLNLEKVRQHLDSKYLITLPLESKLPIKNVWDRLIERLENLQWRTNFETLKISDLPTNSNIEEPLPEMWEDSAHLEDNISIPDLEGETFPEHLNEGDFEQEVIPGKLILAFLIGLNRSLNLQKTLGPPLDIQVWQKSQTDWG